MEDSEVVKKVITYLKSLPEGKKMTYGQVASALDMPSQASKIRKIIERSDSPYFHSVLGGVKAVGEGNVTTKRLRRIAMQKKRGFLGRIFEKNPEETMLPGVNIEGGRIKLGNNDEIEHGRLVSKNDHGIKSDKPNIDLAI